MGTKTRKFSVVGNLSSEQPNSADAVLVERNEQMAELGVGRIMVPAFFFAGPGGLDRLDEFAEKVMPLASE